MFDAFLRYIVHSNSASKLKYVVKNIINKSSGLVLHTINVVVKLTFVLYYVDEVIV